MVSAGVDSYIDLLVLDSLNPRSVRFQIAELREQIERLPGGIEDGHLSEASKAALSIYTELRIAEPHELTTKKLNRLGIEITSLATLIAHTYFA